MADVKIIEIKYPEYGKKVDILGMLNQNNELIKDGYDLRESREISTVHSDQRDGQWVEVKGWLLIYVKD